jgi:hypothetical protein|nr:MAG TPA: Initiation-control protein YabA, DnaA, DnaN, Zinc finger.7A [Caudoviricetes sp.]
MTKTPEELTEDWEAGKLPAGWYYLKLENGEIELQNNCIGGFLMSCNNRVIQILAPVPTYDEYKAMQDQIADAERQIEKLKEENVENLGYIGGLLNEGNEQVIKNRELRALLKECRPYLSYKINQNKHVGFTPDAANLLTRINATLGESEE